MIKINSHIALKLILILALLNSSIYIAFDLKGLSKIVISMMMNISGVLLMIYFFKISLKGVNLHNYFKLLLSILFLWSLFTFFNNSNNSSQGLATLFGNYLMGWAWLAPMAFVFGLNIENWLKLFKLIGIILIIGCVLAVASIFISMEDYPFGALEWFSVLPLTILTFSYQNKRIRLVSLFAIPLYILLTFFASQRANLVFLTIYLFFAFFEFLRQKKVSTIKKTIIILSSFLIFLFLSLKFSSAFQSLSKNKDVNVDTRTFLVVELFSDLTINESIVGRGARGQYFSPYFFSLRDAGQVDGDSPIRSVNEIGYLQMILKGGYVMVGLYLAILIPAAFLGVFRSKNFVAKMCGYYIFAYLLLWTVSYYPIYSTEYILLWMSAGTAMSPKARGIKVIPLKDEKAHEI